MPNVFISYRREDSAASAGRLFDRLSDRFGKEHVFRDLDAIAPGAEFGKVIAERIAHCDALIAVIGKEWLTAKNAEGRRRLDDPRDFVKAEIGEALSRDKLVIPALVEGASMPREADLPNEIAALAGRHAIEVSESRFDYDAERLIRSVEAGAAVASNAPSQPVKRRGWWEWLSDPNRQRTSSFLGAGLAAVVIAGWTGYVHFSQKEKEVQPNTVVSANSGGIAIGRGGTATINIGIAPEKYAADLRRREQEIREELAQTDRANKDKVTVLEKELAAVQAKTQNLDQSLAEYKAKLAEANQALEKLKGDIPSDQLAQARETLAKGDTAAAEALFGKTLKAGKEQAKAGTNQAAEAAFQLGGLAYSRIDYAKAYEYYLEAAQLRPDDPAYLNMAGRIAYDLGRYSEAQPLWEEALVIRKRSLSPDHPDVAQSLNNLAALYRVQGQYAKAAPLYQQSLEIRKKVLGPDDPHVATSLNNLASLYYDQGQYAKAEPLYQQSLEIRKKALGPDHPNVAQSLNNLAALYDDQGQYAKAEPLYQQSLAIAKKALGPDHPDVATSLNNLAALYYAQGQYAKAEPLYSQSLEIRKKALSPDHPDVATSLNSLAALYYAQGQYAKAEPLYRDALRILEKSLPSDHPNLGAAMGNYAVLLVKLNRTPEAQQWQAKAEAIRQRHAQHNPEAR